MNEQVFLWLIYTVHFEFLIISREAYYSIESVIMEVTFFIFLILSFFICKGLIRLYTQYRVVTRLK